MKQYLDLLKNIIENGTEKESGRANMPNTIGLSNAIIKMNMADGFPMLTTKKLFMKGVIHELLWFLRGDTNIKYLVDNNVNIWNGDAYRWYLKWWNQNKHILEDNNEKQFSLDEFVAAIKNGNITERQWYMHSQGYSMYTLGDLGKVYGYQWRNQNGVDQVADVINGLQTNPYSRYHIIDGWNKADFPDMALPPCHLLYQFIVRPASTLERQDELLKRTGKTLSDNCDDIHSLDTDNIPKFYLDLNMYQRSCDTALGVPFNIASMSLLLHIVAKTCNMIPGIATWLGGDTHLYVNHIENAKKQIERVPFKLPTIKIEKDLKTLEDIENLTIDDIIISGYQSHDKIEFPLFVGLK